jgi:hypothetical protein
MVTPNGDRGRHADEHRHADDPTQPTDRCAGHTQHDAHRTGIAWAGAGSRDMKQLIWLVVRLGTVCEADCRTALRAIPDVPRK